MVKEIIVVIEDEAETRLALGEILGLQGYKVWTFENGKVALDKFKESPDASKVGLILLDLIMPVMDGWEFLKNRKVLPEPVSKIPIYILSAVVDSRDLSGNDINGFLRKPISAMTLTQTVEGYCQKTVKHQHATE